VARAEHAVLEVGPDGDAKFAAGLLQARKRIAVTAAVFAARATSDFAPPIS
jgi:hypothetical protein